MTVYANLPVDAVCPICNVRLTATNTKKVASEEDVVILMCVNCNPKNLSEIP